jgi:hypothetical protein
MKKATGSLIRLHDSFIVSICNYTGARGSLVVKALGYKPEDRGFETQWGEILKICLILLAALGPGVYSASNRNQYGKH